MGHNAPVAAEDPHPPAEDSPDRCVSLLESGRTVAADFMSRRFFAREPDHPRRRSLELRVALARRDQPRAYLALKALGPLQKLPPPLRFTLAQAAFTVGRLNEAAEAIESVPPHSMPNRSMLLARWRLRIPIHARRLDDAERIVSELETTPSLNQICILGRAEIALKRGDPDEARAILDQIPQTDRTPPPVRFEASFLLARTLELLGDAEGAFAAAARGNRVHVSSFDPTAYRAETDRLLERESRRRLETQATSAVQADAATLIVGMPRSGTSLIEQIVASHPDAAGVGEQQTPFRLADDLAWIRTHGNEVGCSVQEALDDATGRYLRMHDACDASGRRVTNKALGLERILGSLAAILPDARIVFVERDPRDLLLSIHQNPLNIESYPWSTRLDDAEVAIETFGRLVEHWCTVLPNPTLKLSYENLVENQEAETTRLLDFLDLPLDRRCIAFEENDRVVLTPSADQLRRGMNRDGIGRWKRYRSQLGL